MTSRFGIEIEVNGFSGRTMMATERLHGRPDGCGGTFNIYNEGYNTYNTCPQWKVVQEFSLHRGVEIISPILSYDEDSFTKVKTMLQYIRDQESCFMDQNCGQHIHIDASFMRDWHDYHVEGFFKFLMEQYAHHEDTFDSFVAMNRRARNNIYCKTMKDKDLYSIYADREHKLNFCSFFKYHSIEFRQLQGTLNGDASIAWIKLCRQFLENCRLEYIARNPDTSTHTQDFFYPVYRSFFRRRAA